MGKFSTRDITVNITGSNRNKELKDLHFKCKVIKTLSGAPNTSIIKIMSSLNEDTRSLLTSIYGNDGQSKLRVDLFLDNKNYFTGQIVNVATVFNSPEWTTVLYCSDGFNAQRRIDNIETKKGETKESIINSMVDSLKLAGIESANIDKIKDSFKDKSILKRLFYGGNVWDNFKKLIKDFIPDTDIYIDDGVIKVLPKDEAFNESRITLSNFLTPPMLNEQGCTASIQINSSLKIGGLMILQSKSYNQSFSNLSLNRARKKSFLGQGTYKITEISHSFDNFSKSIAKTEITGEIL